MKNTLAIFLVVTVASSVLFTTALSTFQEVHVPNRPSTAEPPAAPSQQHKHQQQQAPEPPRLVDESQQAAATAWKTLIAGIEANVPKTEAALTKGKDETFQITILHDDAKKSDSLKYTFVGTLTLRDHLYMGKLRHLGELHYTNERTYKFGWLDGRWELVDYQIKVIMAPIKSEIGVSATITNLSRLHEWEKLLLHAAL